MASSEARVAANRRNAQRSTGPRTEAGKGRSRANALKHGLSGDGVVLSIGDGPAVDAAEARLAAEIEPDGEIAAALVRRAAVLLVRLGRCADHDHAATAHRVRHAEADFDDRCADEVAVQAGRIEADPADAVRRLRRTPAGVDWLIGQWRSVRHEVAGLRREGGLGPKLADRVGTLLGLQPWDERAAEVAAWQDGCRDLDAEPGTRDRVITQIDAEVVALRALRAEVDDAAHAADRAEAPARALFDDGPAGQRARRYEAAAERGLFRALRELRELRNHRAATPTPLPQPAPASPPPPSPIRPAATAPPTDRPVAPATPPMDRRDWPREDADAFVPLSIGRSAMPAETNPFPFAQTKPPARRPRLG